VGRRRKALHRREREMMVVRRKSFGGFADCAGGGEGGWRKGSIDGRRDIVKNLLRWENGRMAAGLNGHREEKRWRREHGGGGGVEVCGSDSRCRLKRLLETITCM
jgi:hypothetical protein